MFCWILHTPRWSVSFQNPRPDSQVWKVVLRAEDRFPSGTEGNRTHKATSYVPSFHVRFCHFRVSFRSFRVCCRHLRVSSNHLPSDLVTSASTSVTATSVSISSASASVTSVWPWYMLSSIVVTYFFLKSMFLSTRFSSHTWGANLGLFACTRLCAQSPQLVRHRSSELDIYSVDCTPSIPMPFKDVAAFPLRASIGTWAVGICSNQPLYQTILSSWGHLPS